MKRRGSQSKPRSRKRLQFDSVPEQVEISTIRALSPTDDMPQQVLKSCTASSCRFLSNPLDQDNAPSLASYEHAAVALWRDKDHWLLAIFETDRRRITLYHHVQCTDPSIKYLKELLIRLAKRLQSGDEWEWKNITCPQAEDDWVYIIAVALYWIAVVSLPSTFPCPE